MFIYRILQMRYISIFVRHYLGLVLGFLVVGLSVLATFDNSANWALFRPSTPFSKVYQTDIHQTESSIDIAILGRHLNQSFNFSKYVNELDLPHRSRISLIYSVILLRFKDNESSKDIIRRRFCKSDDNSIEKISIFYKLADELKSVEIACS